MLPPVGVVSSLYIFFGLKRETIEALERKKVRKRHGYAIKSSKNFSIACQFFIKYILLRILSRIELYGFDDYIQGAN